jgi:hypothetical protein
MSFIAARCDARTIVPLARGGVDAEENWVTSQLRNSAKANSTLEKLSWKLVPPRKIEEWDGLTSWFINFVGRHDDLIENSYLRTWWRAATALLVEISDRDDVADGAAHQLNPPPPRSPAAFPGLMFKHDKIHY